MFVLTLGLITQLGCGHESLEADENDQAFAEDPDGFYLQMPAPKSAPFGVLGGICGKDWIKCNTTEKIQEVFGSKLKRSSVKTSRKVDRGTSVVSIKFQTPRLVNDHKGSKDNLETIFYAKDGSESFVIKRNGAQVMTSELSPGSTEPAIEVLDHLGGIESYFVVLGSTAFARDLVGHASNMPQYKPAGPVVQCGRGKHKLACTNAKFVLGAQSLIAGATLGFAVGGPIGVAIGATYGLFALALDTYVDCERSSQFDRCEEQRCECRERASGTTKACEDDMSMCCRISGGQVLQSAGDTYCQG